MHKPTNNANELGPDGAEHNPFTGMIRYPAITHQLPEVLREELRRLGRGCGKCRVELEKARGGEKRLDVESEYLAWQHKLAALLAKLRAEYATMVERKFIDPVPRIPEL